MSLRVYRHNWHIYKHNAPPHLNIKHNYLVIKSIRCLYYISIVINYRLYSLILYITYSHYRHNNKTLSNNIYVTMPNNTTNVRNSSTSLSTTSTTIPSQSTLSSNTPIHTNHLSKSIFKSKIN